MLINIFAVIGIGAVIIMGIVGVMSVIAYFNDRREHDKNTKEAQEYYRGWIDEEKR